MTPDELDAIWLIAARRAMQGRTAESIYWLLSCAFPDADTSRLHAIARMARLAWAVKKTHVRAEA